MWTQNSVSTFIIINDKYPPCTLPIKYWLFLEIKNHKRNVNIVKKISGWWRTDWPDRLHHRYHSHNIPAGQRGTVTTPTISQPAREVRLPLPQYPSWAERYGSNHLHSEAPLAITFYIKLVCVQSIHILVLTFKDQFNGVTAQSNSVVTVLPLPVTISDRAIKSTGAAAGIEKMKKKC